VFTPDSGGTDMKAFLPLLVAALVLPSSMVRADDWKEDLDRLLGTAPGAVQEELVAQVIGGAPGWEAIASEIRAYEFHSVRTGEAILDSAMCRDGVIRPFVVYVPPDYDPGEPTPLLVRLHGGVGRAEIIEDPMGYTVDDPFLEPAEEEGWLVLYPFGQDGATWWDGVGMANIRNLIRLAKVRYSVDDDRVWMGGFSDGASGSFTHAMVDPSDYGAFVPLNGHIGVGSQDGDLPLYAPNLSNSPLYVVTTKGDDLYPSARMAPSLRMALDAGGDVLYRELEGTHDLDYGDTEMPRIAGFLKRHRRDPFPPEIVWEAGDAAYGRCHWFQIDGILPVDPEPWHRDYNSAYRETRVTIGFVPADGGEEPGVKVGTVIEGTAAQEMGLVPGDVIVRGGRMAVDDMDGLVEFKATLERGDSIVLTVLRDGEEVTLSGTLPPVSNHLFFQRDRPSGLARVRFEGNRITVESSRVGAFSILIHPDMIRLDDDLAVTWNGQEMFRGRVTPNPEYMLRNFLANRDRELLYVARMQFESEAE
jgi:hypothetical protein